MLTIISTCSIGHKTCHRNHQKERNSDRKDILHQDSRPRRIKKPGKQTRSAASQAMDPVPYQAIESAAQVLEP